MSKTVVIVIFILSFAAGAYFAKGNLFVSGETAFEQKDYPTAYKKLKDDTTPKGQYYLGRMYLEGLGVERNKAEAAKHFQAAAEKGYPEAAFSLGVMSSKGDGIPQNKEAAAKWYRLAADQGNTKALFNLGIMYGTGDGVKKDPAEAFKLIQKSAELGNAAAKEALRKLTGEARH